MTMAYLVSMRSKDPSTRVGAVIVDSGMGVRATGYNGFPRGVHDYEERYLNKEYKYFAENHAEENAILHCAKVGLSTVGCSIYSIWMPCAQCAKTIIQAGIKKVVYDQYFPGNNVKFQKPHWLQSLKISSELFKEGGVEVVKFGDPLLEIHGLYSERDFDPFKRDSEIETLV